MTRALLFLSVSLIAAASFAQLGNPESIVYHPVSNRYLISNTGSGTIAVMDSAKQISTWASGLTNPAGITVVGDTLFCCSLHEVRSYDILTAQLLKTYPVAGAGYLNDITSDGINLYVSDSRLSSILRINIRAGDVDTLAGAGVNRVNGVFYDAAKNRLIACSMAQKAPIWQISLPDGKVSTLAVTEFDVLDGITMDKERYVYVSSNAVPGMGGNNTIYRFDPEFKSDPTIVASDHNRPADIYYDSVHNLLAVPNFGANTIDFLTLDKDK
jgi:DNA-binding beta-propeller fold protein YncE